MAAAYGKRDPRPPGRSTNARSDERNDGALLAAWHAGDGDAGSVLVERYLGALHHFFGTRVSGDVEDVVQQTLLSCLEACSTFRGECSFRTLLYRIARRRLLDHHRAARRNRLLTADPGDLADSSSTAESRLGYWSRTDLIAALRELPHEAQALIALRYWQGFSSDELAQALALPAPTVRTRLFRAHERLRRRMRDPQPGEAAQ